MDKYKFHTEKSIHYDVFRKVCNLVGNKQHLTSEGFLAIVNFAANA
jgi:hypothetical protein